MGGMQRICQLGSVPRIEQDEVASEVMLKDITPAISNKRKT
jgi:hypothetical protein